MIFRKLIPALFLSGFLVVSPFSALPSLAVFDATFTTSVSPATPGANENVSLTIFQPGGTDIATSVTYKSPIGWNWASGGSIGDIQVGSGTFTAVIPALGGESTLPFTLNNDSQDLQGHKIHMIADFFTVGINVDIFVDGDVSTGHSFVVDTPAPSSFATPLTTVINISGTVGEVPFLTNPTVAGDYTWEADFHLGTETYQLYFYLGIQ